MFDLFRADYDYYRVPRTQQLRGKTTRIGNPKNKEKFKSINIVKRKVYIGFLGMLSPNLCFVLTLFIYRFFATF